MGYLAIVDRIGEPIEVDGGLYHRFEELGFPDEKARFMRDYRLLPCDRTAPGSVDYIEGKRDLFVCDDEREYDAMRSMIETCARLAAFGGCGDIVGKRKPMESDLEQVGGFEAAEGGGFLRVDLSESYWYRRFLFGAILTADDVPGDNALFAVVNYDMEGKYAGGSPVLSEKERGDFLGFAESPYIPDVAFLSGDELVIRSKGDTLERVAANIAAALLTLHTDTVKSFFGFDFGYWLAAPLGVSALWADFALCMAKRPITICQECGKPIVENHPPRGVPRKYCGQKCRKRDKRREKREEIERASNE